MCTGTGGVQRSEYLRGASRQSTQTAQGTRLRWPTWQRWLQGARAPARARLLRGPRAKCAGSHRHASRTACRLRLQALCCPRGSARTCRAVMRPYCPCTRTACSHDLLTRWGAAYGSCFCTVTWRAASKRAVHQCTWTACSHVYMTGTRVHDWDGELAWHAAWCMLRRVPNELRRPLRCLSAWTTAGRTLQPA